MKERYSKQAIAEMQAIASICKKKRIALKMRSYILAKSIGINRDTVTSFESVIKMPNLHTVLSIMQHLNINLTIDGTEIFDLVTDPKQTIAQLCKNRRKHLKINQGTLAEQIGVAKLAICYFETNKAKPKISLVLDIMRYLGIEYQITTEYPDNSHLSPEEVIEKLKAHGIKIVYLPYAMMKLPNNLGTRKLNINTALRYITEQSEQIEQLTK